MYFFCFLNIFLAVKLMEWRLSRFQNENGRGRLDFCATTFFFSKINVIFLDVWMILIGLFCISIIFQFQNFPQTNFSRYGGLYRLTDYFLTDFFPYVNFCCLTRNILWVRYKSGPAGYNQKILSSGPTHQGSKIASLLHA